MRRGVDSERDWSNCQRLFSKFMTVVWIPIRQKRHKITDCQERLITQKWLTRLQKLFI